MDALLFSPDLFAVLAGPGAAVADDRAVLQEALVRVAAWLERVAELEFADEMGPPPVETAVEMGVLRASIGDDGEARAEVIVAPDEVAVRLVVPSASACGSGSRPRAGPRRPAPRPARRRR